MVLKNAFCAVCGQKQAVSFDNDPFTEQIDLNNYEKFRRINLTRCQNCGYCSENIFNDVSNNVKDIVASKTYQNLLDYDFMGNFKELPDKEYLELNINELEAYSLVCKELNNNLMAARVLGRIADLKYMLANTYIETKYMKDDDDLNDDYDEIVESLFNQAQVNNEECLNFLRGIKISDPLCKIFVAERLSFGYFYEQARSIIDKLSRKVTVSKDLSKYIENFLTEVEQR